MRLIQTILILLFIYEHTFCTFGLDHTTNRYEFREIEITTIIANPSHNKSINNSEKTEWTTAFYESNPEKKILLGRRIILGFTDEQNTTSNTWVLLNSLIQNGKLNKIGELVKNIFILEANDTTTAFELATRFAKADGVIISHPVVINPLQRHWAYSLPPNDKYYSQQWNLENRAPDGTKLGIDLNTRSAWTIAEGANIVIGIADGGIDLEHPELTNSSFNALHYNFETLETNGMPSSIYEVHGTHVAGIAVAQKNNKIGMTGISPSSRLASWVIFGSSGYPVSNDRLAQMFAYASNNVDIQIHAWGYSGIYLEGPTLIEQIAISNAVKYSRNGKGSIMIRSGGNDRRNGANTTYNGYSNDPYSITVSAVRSDGRAASYSNPGSSILVSAPGGDPDYGFPGIFTTDIHGNAGSSGGSSDLADYIYGNTAFCGSSAAVPQIAGIAALILSINTNLTYRDVQQILLISSKNYDQKDPFLITNGAGLKVSLNTGYGIPNAAFALHLAARWSSRPPLQTITITNQTSTPIPEDGLRLIISGNNIPATLTNLTVLPNGWGPRTDKPSPPTSLVYISQPLQPIASNLSGKAVLMPRISNFFDEAVSNIASAGAAFAIFINNNSNSPDERVVVNVSDFSPVPSVCLSWRDGSALRDAITNNQNIYAQIKPTQATLLFNATTKMLCEHVGLYLKTDHPKRGQLRVTLKSPMGTISLLQRTNYDHTPNPSGWTYYSTHFFYEQCAGIWQLHVSDEVSGSTGNITASALTIYGVPINDTNLNALDDTWEATSGIIGANAAADNDQDGLPNSIEQILNSNPILADQISLDASRYNQNYIRLSWNGSPHSQYRAYIKTNMAQPWLQFTNLNGTFPETEIFIKTTDFTSGFLRIQKF
ncbi:MAG: S8 family serine peptidase [Verrucomicrobiae bacterium]|nr:S8 family serine peptidase [Verrucomicrobiae bacterium]